MKVDRHLFILAVLLTQAASILRAQTTHPEVAHHEEVKVVASPSPGSTTSSQGRGLQFIVYESGRLQIQANNSALSDILSSIGPLIGARIEFPAELANERVEVNVVSASPKEALAALLGGSHYDYVILGSPEHPEAINHVIVRVRNGNSGTPSAAIAKTNGTATSLPPLAKDFYGEARLPNGLTPQEQVLSREELYQKFLSAQQNQRQQPQGQEAATEIGSKPGRH
jgi:hypothetical protein